MKTKSKNLLTFLLILSITFVSAQVKSFKVSSFEKVVISPHISVDFVQSDQERVEIHDIDVELEKLHVDSKNGTLEIYLEGAKTVTKSEKVVYNNYKTRKSIYNGTKVKATVYYKRLETLSLRGEEEFTCKDQIKADEFTLRVYGESEVTLNDVQVNNFTTTLYGESEIFFKSGKIMKHKITSYGASEIHALKTNHKDVKIVAYGEAEFKLDVSGDLKVTAYGEANVEYKGDAIVDRGIILGEANIRKIN